MDLTYREKRIWIDLTAPSLVYLVYFVELQRGAVTINSLVAVMIAIVFLQIVLQTILAITSRREAKDERDVAIERIGYRNAYAVLVGALLAWLIFLTIFAFDPRRTRPFGLNTFQIINHILFALLLAEIGKLVSQLVLYRKTA